MRNNKNVTPKDQALMAVLHAMEMIHNGSLSLLHDEGDTPAFQRAARRQVALLHNKMLEKSGFDGMDLPTD